MDRLKTFRSKRNAKPKGNSNTVDDTYALEPPPPPVLRNAPAGVNEKIKEELMEHLGSLNGINEFRRLIWLGTQLLNAVVAELMFRQPDFADHEVLMEEAKNARDDLKYDEYCQKLELVFPEHHHQLPTKLKSGEALFSAYIALWQIHHSLDNPSLVRLFMGLNRTTEEDADASLSGSPVPSLDIESYDTPKLIAAPAPDTFDYENQPLPWYPGKLNELGQKKNCIFEYRPVDIVPEPGHLSAFKFEVLLGNEVVGSGTEVSKKKARQKAAKEAYLRFRAIRDQE